MEPNWALARKKPVLEKRARILQGVRAFFSERSFLEIETPHRIPGNAPELHIDAVTSGDWFLHTSPELAMKRLLSAGYPRLFQLCKCWRAAERGEKHLPEFTMLEWYRAKADYRTLMTDCEELLHSLCPTGEISWQGKTVRLDRPWQRITVAEAFDRYAEISLVEALETDCFDEVISFEVEPKLGVDTPIILYDYPSEMAALARKKPGQPEVAERFELYILGLELANAFSELTDPVEQTERFEEEEATRRRAGKAPYPPAKKFLSELSAMPPSAGIALGIDRLVMLLTDSESIDDVVAFTPEDL